MYYDQLCHSRSTDDSTEELYQPMQLRKRKTRCLLIGKEEKNIIAQKFNYKSGI